MKNPWRTAAFAVGHMARRLIDARKYRDARINHAVAEAAYHVPQRPVFPPEDE